MNGASQQKFNQGTCAGKHKPKTKNYKLAIFAAMTEKILILDFGSQYTQLIARTVREANVYCEIIPYNKEIEFSDNLKGVILSGSPFSVNDENALLLNIKDIVDKVAV